MSFQRQASPRRAEPTFYSREETQKLVLTLRAAGQLLVSLLWVVPWGEVRRELVRLGKQSRLGQAGKRAAWKALVSLGASRDQN